MKQSFATAIIILFFACSLSAQTMLGPNEPTTQPMSPSYYALNGESGLTISVNLWGYVGKPGRYDVPSSTDLVQLISLAGGPTADAELNKVEIVRQEMQPDSTFRPKVIPVNLEKFKSDGDQTPLLSPGDTIIVPGSSTESLRLALSILAPLFSLVTAVGTLILILRR